MKQTLQSLALLGLMIPVLVGCAKREGMPAQSTYTFSNQTGKDITFDVYDTREDYLTQTNRLQRHQIKNGTSLPIVFGVARKYWIDWYSAGYSFNNWQSLRNGYNRSSPAPELDIAMADDHIGLHGGAWDTTRSVLLGDGLSSTWRATGSGPVSGTHELVFRKDFLGEYTYTNEAGEVTKTPFEYFISSASHIGGIPMSFAITVLSSEFSSQLYTITCNPGNVHNPGQGRDVMHLQFTNSNSYPVLNLTRQ